MGLSQRLTVLVADSAPTRLAVRMTLGAGVELCAEAASARAAVRAAVATRPDLALIGRSLSGGGIEAVREIRERVPECAVVVLADSDDTADLVAVVRAGAIGYLPVGFTSAQLERAIGAIREHQAAIPRSMVRELLDEIHLSGRAVSGGLSLREEQVLRMLSAGESTGSIATSLAISPVTVRRHISALVRKAGVAGRTELIRSQRPPAGPPGAQSSPWRTA